MTGRPPKPLEQRRRTGRSPGRDSGGRPLPDVATVTALPGVVGPDGSLQLPPAPAVLRTADDAALCVYRDRSRPEAEPCAVCLAEVGRTTWDRLWTAGKTWLSPQTDLDIMRDLCVATDELEHHRHVLHVDGPYVKGQRGGLVAHPAVAQKRNVEQHIARLRSQCGFTPVDRGRMGVGEVRPGTSGLAQILARRLNPGASETA